MIKISIIIPIYNVARYIKRCIDSILIQEGDNYDIECVFVNDCTPDDSMEIVHAMVDDYHGNICFVFCNHEINKGISAARNTGLDVASGEYILFVDSDDYLTSDCIQKMTEAISLFPQTDMVFGNARYCKYGGLFFPPVSEATVLYDNSQILCDSFVGKFPSFAWNRLIRREFILNNKLFFVDGILYEDMPWCYRLYSELGSMVVLPDVTYVYEDNVSSITNITKERINDVINSFCFIIEYIQDHIYEKVWIDSMIYCFSILLRTMDKASKYGCSRFRKKDIKRIRSLLFFKTLRSWHIFMALFFLSAFKPFSYIFRFSWFRKKYDKAAMIISIIENRIFRFQLSIKQLLLCESKYH